MNTPDESVMLAVKGNDVGQLAIVFERHYRRLFDYFFRMTMSRTVSEDLVQDVFVRMLKYRNSFNTGSRFVPWMFKIARNARLQYFKSKQRDETEFSDIDPNTVPVESVDTERTFQLYEALFRLPEDKRELLILAKYHGLSSEELAELLEIDVGTLRVRLHRAMNDLRELLLNPSKEKTPCIAQKRKTGLRTT